MRIRTPLFLAVFALLFAGAAWASAPGPAPLPGAQAAELVTPAPDAEAPDTPADPLAGLSDLLIPEAVLAHHGGGYCAIVHTYTLTQCQDYCYFEATCGFHHFDASTCTCYCGGDLP